MSAACALFAPAGTPAPILARLHDATVPREAHDYRLKPRAVAATFHYFARRVLKQERDVLE